MTDGALPSRRTVIKRFRKPEPYRRQALRSGLIGLGVVVIGLALRMSWWQLGLLLAGSAVNLAVAWFLYQRRPLD